MKKMTRIAALITFAGLLCACNTVQGLGQDVEKAGQKVSNAAERAKYALPRLCFSRRRETTAAEAFLAHKKTPPAGGVFTKMPHYSNIFAKAKPSTRLNAMLSSPGIMKLWLRI